MGLFSRFRTSSIQSSSKAPSSPFQASSTSSPPSHHGEALKPQSRSEDDPGTPMASSNAFPTPTSQAPNASPPKITGRDLSRPAIPPPSPSASSIVSRISRKPWKRATSIQPEPTPQAGGGKRKLENNDKGEGREQDDHFGGMLYAGISPPKLSTFVGETLPAPATFPRQNDNRITTNHSGDAITSSPPRSPTSPGPTLIHATSTPVAARQQGQTNDRPASGLFRQEGGVLGRLNFEIADISGADDQGSWAEHTSVAHERGSERDVGDDQAYVSDTGESAIIVDTSDIAHERDLGGNTRFPNLIPGEGEGPLEMLESPEKKAKFWKGKGRARRSSKAAADHAELERAGSPTPRKANASAAPPAEISVADLEQPRPQQLRRPSSSLFHNPFTRSVSRASLVLDLDRSPADDRSFQLRGFRHVSGMSDVEGSGGLEGYLSHVKKESAVPLALDHPGDKAATSSPHSVSDNGNPPSSFPRPRMTSATLSRPPSIAGSMASVAVDDLIASSNKVSLAAFRKGIRRPSEVFGTMSDLGHDHGYANFSPGDADEDDHDVPLELSMSKQSANSIHSKSREESIVSLSSMGDNVVADGQPSRHASPSPGLGMSPALSFTVQRHQRNSSSSGGFLLKSTMYTRSAEPSKNRTTSAASGGFQPVPMTFATPPTSTPSSPAAMHPDQESMSSPDQLERLEQALTPVDSYFAKTAPAFTDRPVQSESAPTPLHLLQSEPDFGQNAFPAPLLTSRQTPNPATAPYAEGSQQTSPRRGQPPPVEPIRLPEPGDKTPASLNLNLPLPPDQMPDTPPRPPPKALHESPQRLPDCDERGYASTSGLAFGGKKRLSLLDEPMRLISGFWASQSVDEEGFDPALVVCSMDTYGEGDEDKSSQAALAVDDDQDEEHKVTAQRSRSTPFDIRTATPGPVSAVAAASSSLSTPVTTPVTASGIRSPLSERLANVAISSLNAPALHVKPSLPHLRTDFGNFGHQSSTQSTSASPMDTNGPSDCTTARNSPSVESAVTLVSRFARAEKEQEGGMSSSESKNMGAERKEDVKGMVDLEDEARRRFQRAEKRAILSSVPVLVETDPNTANRRASAQGSTRRVPGGPRNPSVRNRITSNASSIMDYTSRRDSSGMQEVLQQPYDPRVDSDSGDDEPLAVIKHRASRSSISLISMPKLTSPPSIVSSPSTSLQRVSTQSPPIETRSLASSSGREGERHKTLIELGHVNRPVRDQSVEQRPISRNRSSSMVTDLFIGMASVTPTEDPHSSTGKPPVPARSPARSTKTLPLTFSTHATHVDREAGRDKGNVGSAGKMESASSASSVSGGTNATTNDAASQRLMTPEESSVGSGMGVAGGLTSDVTDSLDGRRKELNRLDHQRQYSKISQPLSHIQHHSQMDPAAVHAMLKQQWQMQFMAAAYRASEEEWERASSISGHGGGIKSPYPPRFGFPDMSEPASTGAAGGFIPPPFAQGYGYPQPLSPGSDMFPQMPYGYVQLHPFAPQYHQQLLQQQQHQGRGREGGGVDGIMYGYGYGYGTGSQSVFGGEFGPPRVSAPSQSRSIGTGQTQFMGTGSREGQSPHDRSKDQDKDEKRDVGGGRRKSQSVYEHPTSLSLSRRPHPHSHSREPSRGISVTGGNVPTPPSSWRRSTSTAISGDWDDREATTVSSNKVIAHPQTTFIN